MKIIRKAVYEWNGTVYCKVFEDSIIYEGPVMFLCGATQAQTNIQNSQISFYNQMTQQAQQVFGQDSQVFNQLLSTFTPIVAAGPSQQGFSQQELANLNSQAVTGVGQNYKNAKEAVSENEAAQGGGNLALPSGANVGADLSLASSAANQTAGEESQITQANYATGRQNYEQAVAGLESAPGVFNSSANFSNSTTGAGNAAASTANQISQDQDSWINATIGALGGVAGAAVKALPFSGASSTGGGYDANLAQTGNNIQTEYSPVTTTIPYNDGSLPGF